MSQVLTTAKAAEFLGIKVPSIRKASALGWLPHTWGLTDGGQPVRLFSIEDLQAYRKRVAAKHSAWRQQHETKED